jgi:hypothetical protein
MHTQFVNLHSITSVQYHIHFPDLRSLFHNYAYFYLMLLAALIKLRIFSYSAQIILLIDGHIFTYDSWDRETNLLT